MGKMDDLMRELDKICEDAKIEERVRESKTERSSEEAMKAKMNIAVCILENTKNLTRENCIDVFGGTMKVMEELLKTAILAPNDKTLNEGIAIMGEGIKKRYGL